jgi:hypothetical protein
MLFIEIRTLSFLDIRDNKNKYEMHCLLFIKIGILSFLFFFKGRDIHNVTDAEHFYLSTKMANEQNNYEKQCMLFFFLIEIGILFVFFFLRRDTDTDANIEQLCLYKKWPMNRINMKNDVCFY